MLGYYDTSYEPAQERRVPHRGAARRDEAGADASCTSPSAATARARAASRRCTRPRRGSPAARRSWSATTSPPTSVSWPQSRGLADQIDALDDPRRRADRRARARLRRARRHLHLPLRRLAARPGRTIQLQAMRHGRDGDGGAPAPASISAPMRGSRTCGRRPAQPTPVRAAARPRRQFPAGRADRARSRATAATSTRRRSPRRAPPRCCAAAISPTPPRPTRRRWRSTCRPTACGSRCRCSRASATARASARCSATASSAACTTTTASPRSTSSSTRCARRSRWSPTRWRRPRRRPTCRSRRSRRATSSTAASCSTQIDGERRRHLSVRPAPTLPRRRQRRRGRGDHRQANALRDVYDALVRSRPGGRRAPGGAGQLRPHRRDARRLFDRQLPARAGGGRRRRPPASASPTASRVHLKPGLAPRRRRHAARAGRAGGRRLAGDACCRRSARSAAWCAGPIRGGTAHASSR